jgi:hypothetical protein
MYQMNLFGGECLQSNAVPMLLEKADIVKILFGKIM